jgi:hypothetical protein
MRKNKREREKENEKEKEEVFRRKKWRRSKIIKNSGMLVAQ